MKPLKLALSLSWGMSSSFGVRSRLRVSVNGPASVEPEMRTLLGVTPKVNLRDGVKISMDWFRKEMAS